MNSKEALKDLRDVKGWNEVEFNKRLDVIEEDLKRNEPVIPFDIEFVDLEPSIGVCVCGALVHGGQHYCDLCGQKLDWEIGE